MAVRSSQSPVHSGNRCWVFASLTGLFFMPQFFCLAAMSGSFLLMRLLLSVEWALDFEIVRRQLHYLAYVSIPTFEKNGWYPKNDLDRPLLYAC